MLYYTQHCTFISCALFIINVSFLREHNICVVLYLYWYMAINRLNTISQSIYDHHLVYYIAIV